MSVIRLRGEKPQRLVELADRILQAWREYSDESADILSHTGDTPHNTITPIARRRGVDYEPRSIPWGCSILTPSTTTSKRRTSASSR